MRPNSGEGLSFRHAKPDRESNKAEGETRPSVVACQALKIHQALLLYKQQLPLQRLVWAQLEGTTSMLRRRLHCKIHLSDVISKGREKDPWSISFVQTSNGSFLPSFHVFKTARKNMWSRWGKSMRITWLQPGRNPSWSHFMRPGKDVDSLQANSHSSIRPFVHSIPATADLGKRASCLSSFFSSFPPFPPIFSFLAMGTQQAGNNSEHEEYEQKIRSTPVSR